MNRLATPRVPALARGFTMIEILIVVTIIGILAAIAVPKLANASHAARESSLKDSLRLLRTQIGVYRSQHQDLSPGYPGGDASQTPTADATVNQLMKCSDVSGNTSDAASDVFKFGPYVALMPVNPVSSLTTWKVLGPSDGFVADDSTGWLYQPSTGTIKANVSGSDSAGKPIIDY